MTDKELDEMLDARLKAHQTTELLANKDWDDDTKLAVGYIISVVEKAITNKGD